MSAASATRPFPWKCGHCREKAVERTTMSYESTQEYDGKTYLLRIENLEVPRCQKCGELTFDVVATRQLTDALRREVGLLFPEQIRQNREALGLRQRDLANQLGIAESTLSRWETGAQIQQRSLDRLMRLFFALASVREALQDAESLKRLGETSGDHGASVRSASGERSEAFPLKPAVA